ATLKELEKPGFYEHLNQTTRLFLDNLKSLAKAQGISLTAQSVGSLFGLFFTEAPRLTNYHQVKTLCCPSQYAQFFHGMLKEGVYFAPSAFEAGFISTAHTPAILDYTLEAAEKVFSSLRRASAASAFGLAMTQ